MSEINALDISGISLSFGGNRVLSGIDIAIKERTLFALIGPNGAGKTSLFNVLTRHYQAQSGTVNYFGRDLFAMRPHELASAGIMRTFQHALILKEMSVLENVLVGLHSNFRASYAMTGVGSGLACAEERSLRDRARLAIDLVGLGEWANRSAGALPLGHQRLLELARCVVSEPRIILLDEPSAGMSSEEVEKLKATIDRIREALSPTILLIAHTMKLVMSISDRIAVLDHGIKIADGTPAHIMKDPAVIAAYVGAST